MRKHGRVLSKKQLVQIIDFARSKYETNDFNHNIDHMELTVRIAGILAKKEGADAEICMVAAYLHDIGRKKIKGRHGEKGAGMARVFLEKMELSPVFVNAVCYCISRHDSGSPKRTKEAAVLWDADKLQAVGPFGFIRIFAHHLIYDTRDIYLAKQLAQKKIRFFYQRFHTRTGKALAKRLHNYMDEFYALIDLVKKAQIEKISRTKDA